MTKIIGLLDSSINNDGAPLADLRTQIKKVYFSYLSEVKSSEEKIVITEEKMTDDELWEFEEKPSATPLYEFAEIVKLSIDDLRNLWRNSNIIVRVDTSLYVDDYEQSFFPYSVEPNESKADSSKRFLSADQITADGEQKLDNIINRIEDYKTSFKDKNSNITMKEILRLKAEIEYYQKREAELAAEMALQVATSYNPASGQQIATIEKEMKEITPIVVAAERKLITERAKIIKLYAEEKTKRGIAFKQGNKRKHAVRRKLENLTGTKKSKWNVKLSSQQGDLVFGKTVSLVIESTGLEDDDEVVVNIYQAKEKQLLEKDEQFSFIDEGAETKEFIVKTGKYEIETSETADEEVELDNTYGRFRSYPIKYEHTKEFNNCIDDDLKEYEKPDGKKVKEKRSLIKFNLKTSDNDKNEGWEKLLKAKSANLYLKVKAKREDVKYRGEKYDGSKLMNFWYSKEGSWLTLAYDILIKKATDVFHTAKPNSQHLCAYGTYNHANNYVRLLRGEDDKTSPILAAGGNANDDGYHKNLEKLGYVKDDRGTITRQQLLEALVEGKETFHIGDVVVYWTTDKDINKDEFNGYQDNGNKKWTNSHKRFGHTQIFTNGLQTDSNGNLWATDDQDNFGAKFVYGSRTGQSWRFIIFRSPTS